MAPAKKRTDIYNLSELAPKVMIINSYQKLNALFNDASYLLQEGDLDKIIKAIEAEHKKTITKLKGFK